MKTSELVTMSPKKWALSIIGCGALFSLLGTVALSFADNNPATSNIATSSTLVVPYEGYLMLDSTPLNGTQQMKFSLYEAASGGTVQWIEAQDVAINAGRFSVALGTGTKDASITQTFSEVVLDAQQLYLAISVYDATAAAWIDLSGRQAIEAVPYAAWSANSADLNVAGTATIKTLSVTDSATIKSLNVTSASTFTGALTLPSATITGNLATGGDISASGDVNVGSDVNVTGDVSVNGQVTHTPTCPGSPKFSSYKSGYGSRLCMYLASGGNNADYDGTSNRCWNNFGASICTVDQLYAATYQGFSFTGSFLFAQDLVSSTQALVVSQDGSGGFTISTRGITENLSGAYCCLTLSGR